MWTLIITIFIVIVLFVDHPQPQLPSGFLFFFPYLFNKVLHRYGPYLISGEDNKINSIHRPNKRTPTHQPTKPITSYTHKPGGFLCNALSSASNCILSSLVAGVYRPMRQQFNQPPTHNGNGGGSEAIHPWMPFDSQLPMQLQFQCHGRVLIRPSPWAPHNKGAQRDRFLARLL